MPPFLDKRKLTRQEEKEREEEEDIRKASHADSLDQTKIQLEHEKQVGYLLLETAEDPLLLKVVNTKVIHLKYYEHLKKGAHQTYLGRQEIGWFLAD